MSLQLREMGGDGTNMALSGLDFTLEKYKDLCQHILACGYEVMTVSSYLQDPKTNNSILVVRHDVDRFLGKAIRMASLEQSLGIRTTYYFRKSGFSQPNIIKSIADMGHEIGYHYEVLDKAKGNHELAMTFFREHLYRIRQIARVETICMHGNPLTKWLNRDIWKYYDFRELGLKGEAYLSLENIYYLSDTGRTWDVSRKVKDTLPSALPNTSHQNIFTTDDVIKFIEKHEYSRIYIVVHPERWSHNLIVWAIDQARDTGINTAKLIWRTVKRYG